MQNVIVKFLISKARVLPLACLALAGVIGLPVQVSAVEDPPGCSLANGGAGNTSLGGINFNLAQAHVGDTVEVFPSLGMAPNACKADRVTGVVYIATGVLTNFLENVTLNPGEVVSCPADGLCRPGPYALLITPALVGADVSSPIGVAPGDPKSVRAVENGAGTVHSSITDEHLSDFHSASIEIVTPCIQVIKQWSYPAGTNCFPIGAANLFTGYVTNCGDIPLTNVVVVDNRAGRLQLFDPISGAEFSGNMPLPPGGYAVFANSFLPTSQETCAASVLSVITTTATDTTVIGGPHASVTNSSADISAICAVPAIPCQLVCPPNVYTNAGPLGVVVNFPTPAILGDCPGAEVICTPPSGAIFRPGTNLVQCRFNESATCPNTCNFAVIVALVSSCPLPSRASAVETDTLRVRQTGLFYQTVGVTNPCVQTLRACRLYVEGLSPDVQVYNAAGVSNGTPYLQYNLPVQPFQEIEFAVEYYATNWLTLPAPTFRAEAVLADLTPPPDGTVVNVLRAVAYTNCAFLVEFSSLTNRTYYFQYTSDPTTNAVWQTAAPPVIGNGTALQWLDSGPPKTESLPCTQTNRYYRVILAP